MSKVNEIKTLLISPVEQRGALKAFAEIKIGNLVISDCRIIKEDGK